MHSLIIAPLLGIWQTYVPSLQVIPECRLIFDKISENPPLQTQPYLSVFVETHVALFEQLLLIPQASTTENFHFRTFDFISKIRSIDYPLCTLGQVESAPGFRP